jgi:hypothetical protein
MKIAQIERVRLVEGLDRNASRTYRLWESAGYVLKEFQLDQKQIDQLFGENATISIIPEFYMC